MGTNEGTDTVTVKVENADSASNYKTGSRSVTNSITWNDPTVTYSGSTSFGASGGTITLSSSNISITQSGSYSSGSVASDNTNISALDFSQSASATGFTYAKTGSSPIYSATNTAENNTTTSSRTGNTITITATGNGNKSATMDVSFTQAAGAIVYDAPVVSAFTYSESVSAAGVTDLSPATLTCTRTYTWNGVSGSGDTETITSGITWAFTNSGSSSYVTNGTDFATTGKINVESRGNAIGNARNFYTSISVIATVGGVSSASKQATAGTQNGNYVVSIVPRATSGSKHFKYNNIGPGDTSASPTLTGGATYTFSSGSTKTSAPTGGTATYTRTYSLGSVQNGFKSINSSTGVLTATSYGTTIGPARTSGTVTSVLTVTYVHNSTYSAGGTVTSSQMTSTNTCTQTANSVTNLSFTVEDDRNNLTMDYGYNASPCVIATFTTNKKKNVTSEVTYNIAQNDIVELDTHICIWIDDYTTYGTREDMSIEWGFQNWNEYINEVIMNPGKYTSNKYVYTGTTHEYNGNTYYLWKYVQPSSAQECIKYLLTSTIDYQTLYQASLEYDPDDNTDCPFIVRLDEDLVPYDEGRENWLIKVEIQ